MTWILAIVVLYVLLVNPQILQGFGASITTPGGTLQWPPGPGQPGYVTIDEQPAPAGYSLGNTQTAMTASSLAGTAAGATLGIGAAVGATSSGGALAAGTFAGTAIPIVGVAVAAVGLVVGFIAKHHAEMVAKEAAELNQAVPLIIQRYVLIVQAAVHGDISDMSMADGLIQQAITDYYTIVHPMLQGKWPWPYDKTTGVLAPDSKKPGTCNGPCVVGHWWIETGAANAYVTVGAILAGKHGVSVFGPIPSHAGFAGLGRVQVIY
jgi:hypothetical protein